MNGWDFLDWLQTNRSTPVKGLLLTGESAIESLTDKQQLPWKTLYKPISLDALKTAMIAIVREC